MRRLLSFAALLVALCPYVTPSRAAAPAADTHHDAAVELIATVGIERQAAAGVEAFANQMVQQNPALGPYKDVVVRWALKYTAGEGIREPVTAFYEEAFSEAELRELTAFYRTPLGQKTLTVMPALFSRSMELGSQLGKAHIDELRAMIADRAKELEKLNAPPAAPPPAPPAASPPAPPAPPSP